MEEEEESRNDTKQNTYRILKGEATVGIEAEEEVEGGEEGEGLLLRME